MHISLAQITLILLAAAFFDILCLAGFITLGHINWRNWRRIKTNDLMQPKTWTNHLHGLEAHTVPDNDKWDHEWDDCGCSPKTVPVPRDDGSMGWKIIHNAMDGRTN